MSLGQNADIAHNLCTETADSMLANPKYIPSVVTRTLSFVIPKVAMQNPNSHGSPIFPFTRYSPSPRNNKQSHPKDPLTYSTSTLFKHSCIDGLHVLCVQESPIPNIPFEYSSDTNNSLPSGLVITLNPPKNP